jgi:hypothetical protein
MGPKIIEAVDEERDCGVIVSKPMEFNKYIFIRHRQMTEKSEEKCQKGITLELS